MFTAARAAHSPCESIRMLSLGHYELGAESDVKELV